MKISAIILSSQAKINPLVLESVSFCDEIIIISSVPVTRKGTSIKAFYHPLNNDFAAQRNFGLSQAKGDWILFLDTDEYVSTELALEIKAVIKSTDYSGFLIRRLDLVYHQSLNHGETGNTKILRLAKRKSGVFVRPVHETWKIDGMVGELASPLYHLKDHFVGDFIPKIIHYGQIDSEVLVSEDKPFSLFRLLIYPLAKFKLNYIFRLGFLDGYAGIFQAYLMAVQSLSVRIFQWQNQI